MTTRQPRSGTFVQLDLPFFGPRSVRATLDHFMAIQTDGCAEATLGDYQDRVVWLLREFGEMTDIATIGFDGLQRIVSRWKGVILNVTIKKRLALFRRALRLAQQRGLLAAVPDMPRLRNDSEDKMAFQTPEQWEVLRGYLPPQGGHRRLYDLGFWTGMRLGNLFKLRRDDFDLYRPVIDGAGTKVATGMYQRHSDKNGVAPVWLPMQPELALVAREMLIDVPGPGPTLLVGKLWNVRRTFHAAADRAIADGHLDMTKVSPNDLRRSFATMLEGRGYLPGFVRIALGHKGGVPVDFSQTGRLAARATVLETHYLRNSPALISSGVSRP